MKRVLILRGLGFNCEDETEAAYRLAGAEPVVGRASAFLAGETRLDGFDVLHVSGGFTFGDELGAGQVFAQRLREEPIWAAIRAFLARRGRIVGVCNGFQILVRAGLLPNVAGTFTQEVSLAPNASGRFVDRWVTCTPSGVGARRFGAEPLDLPIRHGEGRLVIGSDVVRTALRERGLVTLRYDGESPNGSDEACAALLSADGLVFGTMPHPEAFFSMLQHPAWPTKVRRGEVSPNDEGDGLRLLRGVLRGDES